MTQPQSWPVVPAGMASRGAGNGQPPTLRFASLAGSRHVMQLAAEQLTQAETTRALRFVRPADRERFILGRWLLRSMLSSLFDVEARDCEPDQNGKLHLPARPDIAFNIAHSGDLVLVGVGANMELGVDVEQHRDDVDFDGVGRLIFTRSETAAVLSGPPQERQRRFFRQWALKEALVKALGTGLLREPRRFAIDPMTCPPSVTFVGDGADDVGIDWNVADLPTPDSYAATVAWRPLPHRVDSEAIEKTKHG